MAVFITRSAGETEALGQKLGKGLARGALVTLTGPLGAGKTVFCRGMAAGMGCTDPVQSPTFTIANFYRGSQPFAHLDAYRVTGADDLETAGLYGYLDAGVVTAVEWGEKIAELLPPLAVRVTLEVLPQEDARRIVIEGAQGFE